MATVGTGTTGSNTGSAWATEQHSVATDKALSEFPLQRYTLLTTNTLRVNPLSFETVALRESLSDTLPELEAFEVNDLLMVTQALTAVRTNCEDLKNTAVSTELDEKVAVLCWNPSLHRFLTSATVHQLTTNFVDESQTVEALTTFNRLYLDHCWTTGALEGNNVHLDKLECRSGFGILLPFTARELIEPLQTELNCNQLFGMHCRGLCGHCTLTEGQLELMYEDVHTDCTWRSIYTNDSLPLKMKKKKNFKSQDDTDHTELTSKVNVEITGLPISTDGVTLTITGSN